MSIKEFLEQGDNVILEYENVSKKVPYAKFLK